MPAKRCLYCYNELEDNEIDFHSSCSRKIFSSNQPPELPYTEEQMMQLGLEVVKNHIAVPGVQPKISLDLEITKTEEPKGGDKKMDTPANKPRRFTIKGLWGEFILKPPAKEYPHLPEVEDATMHLAELAGIATVPHSLIRLQSGNLAYITKRIDRTKKIKIHMEDMCQMTERLTEDKYKGSYEQIAKAIANFSTNPGLDLINFFEQLIFSFLTGNADMHLKNFSLINQPGLGYVLSPAYDMVATSLLVKGDKEELALHLNGKKSRIKRKDFDVLFDSFKIDSKSKENSIKKFQLVLPQWYDWLERSFLPAEMKDRYIKIIKERTLRLAITIIN